jgi:hypothetical protein
MSGRSVITTTALGRSYADNHQALMISIKRLTFPSDSIIFSSSGFRNRRFVGCSGRGVPLLRLIAFRITHPRLRPTSLIAALAPNVPKVMICETLLALYLSTKYQYPYACFHSKNQYRIRHGNPFVIKNRSKLRLYLIDRFRNIQQ